MLDNTVKTTSGDQPPAACCVPAGGVRPAGCASAGVNSLTMQRAFGMLNLLESYAHALQDPKRSLRSIEPLVSQIRNQIQSLKSRAHGQDEGLLKLVDEIAVTATVETLKFERGDYVV